MMRRILLALTVIMSVTVAATATARGDDASPTGIAGSAVVDLQYSTTEVLSGTLPQTEQVHRFPAPYSNTRWRTVPEWDGHPWICVGNESSFAFQDAVNQWNDEVTDGLFGYRLDSCPGVYDWSRISVMNGDDDNRGCIYLYKTWNSAGTNTRMIIYFNRARLYDSSCGFSNGALWQNYQHWRMYALGYALGNLPHTFAQFNGGDWVSVMNIETDATVIDVNYYDGKTFDYFN